MLTKLIRHEFRATSRIMWPIFAGMLALTLAMRASQRVLQNDFPWLLNLLAVLVTIGFVFGIMALCFAPLVLSAVRFRDHLLKDEGYLTLTLPVNMHQLLASKLIVSAVWYAAAFLAVVLLCMIGAFDFSDWRVVPQFAADFLRAFRKLDGALQGQALLFALELFLFCVLGMDRGALTSLLFWETAFSALVSLTAGLALGVLLTQLSARVLSHFARTELPALPLLDLGAVRFCVLTDAFIFFLLLLNAWRQVRRASAVSLLRSDSLGERPPRSQWLLVLPGLGLLGGAYYLAVTITEPITAMLVFFVAVIMVILATFLLFIAGSVTLCRTLQGNDRFYYQKKNFVALSSLVYRMKRSGAGLAVICILSTMILVMLGSTAGLYFGAEDVVRTLSAEMSHEIAAEARAEFYATYGSLFFLALVLSTVFLLASVLMLYYKQLSEGYEDAARFAVMQRVGMTKRDIRTSVNAQLRMVFLLPLLAAFVHLAFAQPMIWRILRLFGLQNLPLVLGVTACACAVFTVLYCTACRLTSNAYCRIVGEGV